MTKQCLQIVYDGACPFCSRYVQLIRIRENFEVNLIDARERPDLAAGFQRLGYDLGDGMIANLDGRVYYGSEAVSLLSLLSSRSGFWNKLFSLLFRSRRVSAFAYPLLRSGRDLTLILLRRERSI